MSVSIEIVPSSGSLDMYGEPDRSAAYSISGHIFITISSRTSFFERKRAIRLLLRSLVLTFEGQSEFIAHETAYSAVRLCSVSQELAPNDAVELNTEEFDAVDGSYSWSVVFNLTIPGWLPASSAFGDIGSSDETGTRYALYATAKFENVDESPSGSWLSALCTPFRFSIRTAKAPRCPIFLRRCVVPPYLPPNSNFSPKSLFPSTTFNVSAEPEGNDDERKGCARIPADILSSLRVVTVIPENVGTREESIPFTLRLRTRGLSEADCNRLRITEFAVDVQQTEHYRTHPSPNYLARYPVPPEAEQPPFRPLLSPHPIHTLYDLGVATYPPPRHVLTRSFSVLPDDVSGRYTLAGDGYAFKKDAQPSDTVTWYSMATDIPISIHDSHANKDWIARQQLRETCQSPLFSVSHRLLVTLMCTYDLTDGEQPERASEQLQFHVPLRFVRVPPPSAMDSRTPPLSPTSYTPPLSGVSSLFGFPLPSLPYAQALPAYSQLFDINGERKVDDSIPLPLYTPKAADRKSQVGTSP